jgi:hypothetical protein
MHNPANSAACSPVSEGPSPVEAMSGFAPSLVPSTTLATYECGSSGAATAPSHDMVNATLIMIYHRWRRYLTHIESIEQAALFLKRYESLNRGAIT